ncbi:MAG: pyrroline-5-carboxylate reductase [Alphaproteobacteria bacterium]|nr:MAG: pyrroline-5-carboxylate reductase [Alphaproteobacteria bacterium]
MRQTILLIGCGRMGSAMARKWRDNYTVFICDPHAAPLADTTQIEPDQFSTLTEPLVVALAVKPQIFPAMAESLHPLSRLNPLYVSIMAGVTIATISKALRNTERVVRAMPNTPAAIGQGMTVAVAQYSLETHARETVDALLGVTGEIAWLEQEKMLDPVTALSGSGPAYFYHFTEALAAAGVEIGLPENFAMKLARQTFIGAAALAEHEGSPLNELRESVTSAGGTTAAGLAELNANNALDCLALKCLQAARDRSRELSNA